MKDPDSSLPPPPTSQQDLPVIRRQALSPHPIRLLQWGTELLRKQHSMGHWENKRESDSLLINSKTSGRQEADSHSGTTCIFPFTSLPFITYLPWAQYSWRVRDRNTHWAVPIQHLVSGTSSSITSPWVAQGLLPQTSSSRGLITDRRKGIASAPLKCPLSCPHWLPGDSQHLGSPPDGQDLVRKHYFTLKQQGMLQCDPWSCFTKYSCDLRSSEQL